MPRPRDNQFPPERRSSLPISAKQRYESRRRHSRTRLRDGAFGIDVTSMAETVVLLGKDGSPVTASFA